MRRALIIAAMVIVLIGLLVGLYFLFFASSPHLTVNNGNNFGDTAAGTVPAAGPIEAGTGSNNAGTSVAPNFIEITSSPVSAGEIMLDIPPSNSSSSSFSTSTPVSYTQGDVEVRYIDRQSGNMYSYLALSRKLTRVTDKTLPGIQEASWLPDGSMAFVRFITDTDNTSHVETFALPFDGTSPGYFLQEDLDQATVAGTNSIFTLADGTDNSIGTIANADGTNPKTVFTSPLTSLVIQPAGTRLLAATKASSELDGYAFSVSGNSFMPILGPLRGLTILPSPSGNIVLYSYVDSSDALHMATFDLTTGTVTSLPLATLAEKCVWTSDSSALYCAIPKSVSGNIPDDWYQGVESFTDQIWRIDLTSRLATLVLDPTQTGNVNIDAVNLTIDPNSQVLVFRNKKDSSLWAYSL
jgi:hypothetical protein